MQFRYNPRAYYIGGVYSFEDWQEGPNSCASRKRVLFLERKHLMPSNVKEGRGTNYRPTKKPRFKTWIPL